jgi:choline dehydrogenase
MIFQRGNPMDYERWAAEPGMEQWDFAHCLPYFKKMETRLLKDGTVGADDWRGGDGPLVLERGPVENPLFGAFFEAVQQAGHPLTDDVNGYRQEGFAPFDRNVHRGRRLSAARAYLHPVRHRPNLTIKTLAMVTGLVVAKENGANRVTGVDFKRPGRGSQRATAGEVILCGGAINTPQLLLLSGIGPADELRALGIDVVHDAPKVGRNLQDHLSVGTAFNASGPVSYFEADKRIGNVASWLLRHRGPFSSPIAEAGGFVRSEDGLPAPDLQLLFGPAMFVEHGQVDPPGHGFSLGCYLLQPRSTGRISLRSADPLAPARIEAGYLSDPYDLEVLVRGLRLSLDIAAQQPLARHAAARYLPEAAEDMADDARAQAYVRARSETMYHPTSTAAMGAADDDVCDPALRVRGVDGLRVVDCSAFPAVTRGNTNAPVIMLAEKAADLLRGTVPAQRSVPRTPEVVRP